MLAQHGPVGLELALAAALDVVCAGVFGVVGVVLLVVGGAGSGVALVGYLFLVAGIVFALLSVYRARQCSRARPGDEPVVRGG